MSKKKQKLKLSFVYDTEKHVVTESSLKRLVSSSLDAFLGDGEVAATLKDLKNFRVNKFADYIETGTFIDKEFVSKADGKTYIARTIKKGETGVEFTLSEKLPVWQARRTMYIAAVAVILAVILACVIVIFALRKDMLEKKREEARGTIKNLAEQIDGTISAEFNSWFNELKVISALVAKYGSVDGNEEAIDATIDDIREDLPFDNVGILLESGDIYFTKNNSYSIFYEDFAKELVIEQKAAVDVLTIDGEEVIAFGMPVAVQKNVTSQKIAAVCGISTPSRVNTLLNVGLFNNNSVVAVYRDDGFSVAISENAKAPKNDENLNFFVDLESQKSEAEFSKIEADYLAGNSDLINLTYGKQEYHAYYSKLHFGSDKLEVADVWHLLIYVPESEIFSNVNEILRSVLITLIVVCAFVILVTAALMVMFVVNRDNDVILKKQLAANKLLEQAADSAVEASQAKTVFLSNMSHDIRTPINGIIGMTAIAKKHIGDESTVKDCLNKIDGASSHLLSLVNDVLDMSRIESKKVEIVNEVMNVEMTADECCSILYGQLADREITFDLVKKGISHANVLGDSLHLKQVLINILGNAVKFTPDGGKITFEIEELSADSDAATFSFTVTDTGCGMSDDFLKVIFEPFSQEKNAERTRYNGTGLGLAISAQLVSLMSGSISVTSKLGEGSRFVVTLPFKISEETLAEDKKNAAEGEIADDVKGVRVLLVEDNDLNRELETVLLTESGIIVETAENGKVALDKFLAADTGYYDCILMDVMMPVMDGLTSTARIRSSDKPNAKTIPIVAMTANAFESDIRKTKEAGMNAHLSKPIYIKEVLKVLSRLVKKK